MPYPHKPIDLPYAFDALEPHIDAKTMEIHHDKHHQAYADKLNAAIEGMKDLHSKSAEELVSALDSLPDDVKKAVRNNGGGVANHNFFWPIMKKDVKAEGPAVDAINKNWGSLEQFKEEFSKAAATVFGSGWVWLVVDKGDLEIVQTVNQDSPLTQGKTPILGLDVWEHAYYLKYQNKRPAYIDAFFNVVNWEKVNDLFGKAK